MGSRIERKPPVVTVDGPSGTGKGTLAQRLALTLGWHYLDSGALYRAVGWAALECDLDPGDEVALMDFLSSLNIAIEVAASGDVVVVCQGMEVSSLIRQESVGMAASQLSSNVMIRNHLFELQRSFRQGPGLVTDGRDMGTVIFPDAQFKVYLEASLQAQAQRRYKQLQQRGINANFAQIEADLIRRDQRDRERAASPTMPAADARVIDTTHMAVDEVFNSVLRLVQAGLAQGVSDGRERDLQGDT